MNCGAPQQSCGHTKLTGIRVETGQVLGRDIQEYITHRETHGNEISWEVFNTDLSGLMQPPACLLPAIETLPGRTGAVVDAGGLPHRLPLDCGTADAPWHWCVDEDPQHILADQLPAPFTPSSAPETKAAISLLLTSRLRSQWSLIWF